MRNVKWYHWIPLFWLDATRGSITVPNRTIFWVYVIYQSIVTDVIIVLLLIYLL